MDHQPGEVGQQLSGKPLQFRMGTHQEPCRCSAMDAEKWSCSGYCARCTRPQKEARSHHVHHGPLPESGPELREDFEALSRESSGVSRRLCQGLVKADASRYGPPLAVSWPACSGRATDLADRKST